MRLSNDSRKFLESLGSCANGWVHDRFGTGWMLQTDALSAIGFTVVAPFVLNEVNGSRACRPPENNGQIQ